MRTILLATAATLLLSTAVSAADLIVDTPAPVLPDAAYDWSGFYLGAHAGWFSGEAGIVEPDDIIGDVDGGIAGLYAGYGIQMDNIVVGIEGDIGLADVNGTGTNNPPPPPPPVADDYSYHLDMNGHVRGRVGFAAQQFLVYVAGGLAFAHHTLGEDDETDDQWHTGWTLGVGAEYAVADNVRLRAEYLYDDYGTADYWLDGDPYTVVLHGGTFRVGISVGF